MRFLSGKSDIEVRTSPPPCRCREIRAVHGGMTRKICWWLERCCGFRRGPWGWGRPRPAAGGRGGRSWWHRESDTQILLASGPSTAPLRAALRCGRFFRRGRAKRMVPGAGRKPRVGAGRAGGRAGGWLTPCEGSGRQAELRTGLSGSSLARLLRQTPRRRQRQGGRQARDGCLVLWSGSSTDDEWANVRTYECTNPPFPESPNPRIHRRAFPPRGTSWWPRSFLVP